MSERESSNNGRPCILGTSSTNTGSMHTFAQSNDRDKKEKLNSVFGPPFPRARYDLSHRREH